MRVLRVFSGKWRTSSARHPRRRSGERDAFATLESELATERTAKGMLENQLRACVNEVAKILAAKRELEFRLRDVEGDPE